MSLNGPVKITKTVNFPKVQAELNVVTKEIKRLEKRRAELRYILKLKKSKQSQAAFQQKPLWLYVLELEGGYIYVGMSRHVQKRFIQHKKGHMGAVWTRLHKPLSILYSVNTGITDDLEANKLEDELTFEYVKKYGFEYVRGGGYCQMRPKWPESLREEVQAIKDEMIADEIKQFV